MKEKPRFTREMLEQLKKENKIRGFTEVSKREPEVMQTTQGRIVAKHFKTRNKAKDFIGWNLLYVCNENCLQLQTEYKFHSNRKWKFDWAVPALKIGIEYEGLISEKSRHTTITGYSADSEKYREAAKEGWIVLRYDALSYEKLPQDLKEVIKNKKHEQRKEAD